MQQITVYYITTFELDEMIDNLVGLARQPEFGWTMWQFHISMYMNNDTYKLVTIGEGIYGWNEEDFIRIIKWCQKHHNAKELLELNIELDGILYHGKKERQKGRRHHLEQAIKEYGIQDRPEDYMGFDLMESLCYAGLLPKGTYLVEASW